MSAGRETPGPSGETEWEHIVLTSATTAGVELSPAMFGVDAGFRQPSSATERTSASRWPPAILQRSRRRSSARSSTSPSAEQPGSMAGAMPVITPRSRAIAWAAALGQLGSLVRRAGADHRQPLGQPAAGRALRLRAQRAGAPLRQGHPVSDSNEKRAASAAHLLEAGPAPRRARPARILRAGSRQPPRDQVAYSTSSWAAGMTSVEKRPRPLPRPLPPRATGRQAPPSTWLAPIGPALRTHRARTAAAP